jgi:subtilisin family serine protease
LAIDVVKSDDGLALIKLDDTADMQSAMASAAAMSGVKYVERNYLYAIPEATSFLPAAVTNPKAVIQQLKDGGTESIPVEEMRAQATKVDGQIQATFPNDPGLYTNWGWDWVDAEIIWTATPAASRVCLIDTGVDATSPDLVGKVVHGYDYVNADAVAEDDNGHGTHMAGIITANMNNLKGIAGVANGGVLAVKVLTSQGYGTSYDIALGIRYCANNATIKVISMSLGGGLSSAVYYAVDYAVNPTNWLRPASTAKLLVAAAGNGNSSTPIYPAGFSDSTLWSEFDNKVIAVAALEDPYDGVGNGANCRASFSNYGPWVDLAAPGENIYSTTPNTPHFWLNYNEGVPAQYASMSGTSTATPFVAAAAARTWATAPFTTNTNAQIGARLASTGYSLNADNTCWPTGTTTKGLDVAAAMNRGALTWFLYNANNGLALVGATGQLFTPPTPLPGNVLKGTGVVDGLSGIYSSARLTIINVPAGWPYVFKVSRAGFTATPQWLGWYIGIGGGSYTGGFNFRDAIPPLSSNFDIVASWYADGADLDMYTFLPTTNSVLPQNRVVGFTFNGTLNPLPPPDNLTGSPYARWVRDGGAADFVPLEITRIKPWPANMNWVYYGGNYYVALTDYQSATLGQSLPYLPTINVWKNGVIKHRALYNCPSGAQDWWVAIKIRDAAITSLNPDNYDPDGNGFSENNCGTGGLGAAVLPYPVP